MQRPLGITILAVLAVIVGVLGIIAGFVLVGLSSATAGLALPISGLIGILGAATIVISVLELVLAYGLWGLKPWAWTLVVVLEIAGIVINVLEFRSATASSTVVSIVIAAVILYYLYQPHVRRAFGQNV